MCEGSPPGESSAQRRLSEQLRQNPLSHASRASSPIMGSLLACALCLLMGSPLGESSAQR